MSQIDELFKLLDTSKTGRVSAIVWQSVSALMAKIFSHVDEPSLFPRVGMEFPLRRQRYDTFMSRLFKFDYQKASKAVAHALAVAKFTNEQKLNEGTDQVNPKTGCKTRIHGITHKWSNLCCVCVCAVCLCVCSDKCVRREVVA